MRRLRNALVVLACLAAPPASVALDVDMDPVPRFALRKGQTLTFLINLSGAAGECRGTVSFAKLPAGLEASPAKQDFALAAGESKQLVFAIGNTAWGDEAVVRPAVTVEGDEPVNFPDRLRTTLLRDAKTLDRPPLNADGLLAYYSCGDASEKEYHHFDRCVGNKRFWNEGIWYHAGGVKGRAVFGMNALPYPRHRWSKFAYETKNNIHYRRGTMCFWMRRSRRKTEVPYTPRFKGDPKETWRVGPTAMRGHQGEGLAGHIWSPQAIYTRWFLKKPRPWKPFKPESDSFISLRRYKAVKGLTDGFLEATYLAMRQKRYTVQAPYEWTRRWRHVALVWDTDERRLEIWLDGKKASGDVRCNGKPSTDEAWYGAPWHPGTFCNAAMSICCVSAEGGRSATDRDEYYVYNRALSAEGIEKNMRASMGAVAAPSLAPAGGTFTGSLAVEVRGSWAGAAYRYTLDGGEPAADSPEAKGPIGLTESATLKVTGFRDGFKPSRTVTGTFKCLGPDKNPPRVTGAWAFNDPGSLLVAFSEPVAKAAAETASNYAVDGAAVKAAALEPDGRTVRLTPAGPLTAGEHKLTVRNLRDRTKAANAMDAPAEAAFDFKTLPGLIGYYTFDVLDGPAVKDLSPSRIDGLAWDDLHPGIRRVAGVRGRAVRLDGRDDLVDLSDYADGARLRVDPKGPHNTDRGTLALWVRADPTGAGYKKGIIAKTYAYEIWSTNGNLMHTKNIKLADGAWRHLVVTYDRGQKQFYLDGKGVHAEKSRFLRHAGNGVGLGVEGGGYGQPRFFKGDLDEVMIFNRVLTAEEVKVLHEASRPTKPPS